MGEMLDFIKGLHSSEGISQVIGWGGLIALIAIIFAETGLLVGFFLPGDSLLITAGVLANPSNPNHVAALSIWQLNLWLMLAAILGDQLNFYIGSRVGDRIWKKPDSRFYKRRYMEEAHDFYERYGALAVIGARFVPILRTFVPFAAGVAKMPYSKFVVSNIFGGVFWVTSLLWVGYFVGGTPLANRLDKIIVIVIFVSFLPIIFGVAKRWITGRNKKADGTSTEGETKSPTLSTD